MLFGNSTARKHLTKKMKNHALNGIFAISSAIVVVDCLMLAETTSFVRTVHRVVVIRPVVLIFGSAFSF